jgi:hypothetical protein
VISAKLLDDETVNNKYYSHVGGIPIKELNSLECKLLALMNYDLNVSQYCFELYRYELELQLIRQMLSDTSDVLLQHILKWEDNTPTPPEVLNHLRTKRIRRSRSFNSSHSLDATVGCNKRKNRSISFTILGLIPPANSAAT